VAKTLLISQLNFYVCIIPINDRILNEIGTTINNFIKGQLKINKDMFALDINKGGIGFIDLKKFIISLQCSWVKRAYSSTIDNWRLDLNKATQGNVEILTPEMFNKDTNPILHTIASSFVDFKHEFYLQNDNFINSSILGNPLLKKKQNNGRIGRVNNAGGPDPDPERHILSDEILKLDFWAAAGVVNLPMLSRILIGDLINDTGNIKTDPEIQEILNLAADKFDNFKKILLDSLRFVRKNKYPSYDRVENVNMFLKRFKKGSKNFRKILNNRKNEKIKCAQNSKVKTFFRLIDLPVPEEKSINTLNSEWAINSYPVKLREFIFKFRSNALGLNTRVSHFNRNVNRGCTFCSIEGPPNVRGNAQLHVLPAGRQDLDPGRNLVQAPPLLQAPVPALVPVPDETFIHLFFDCPHTSKVMNNFIQTFLPDLNLHEAKKFFFFMGLNTNTDKIDNVFISTLAVSIMFYIWECKLQKKLPTCEGLRNEIFYSVENIRRASATLRHHMSIDLHICRCWTAEASRRR
jgi:hypothetical protein